MKRFCEIFLALLFLSDPHTLAIANPQTGNEGGFAGALFLIKHHGQPIGNVFGTLHVGFSDVKALPKNVEKALRESTKFYREADVNDPEALRRCPATKMFELPAGQSLKTLLSPATYRLLQSYLDKRKFSDSEKDAFNGLTPFGLIASIGRKYDPPEFDGSPSIDNMLDQVALEKEVPISGLETICESESGFALVSNVEWDSYVRAFINSFNCDSCQKKITAEQVEIARLVLQGDIDRVFNTYKSLYTNEIDVFVEQRKIFISRNENMAKKISLLENSNQKFFVAIGALHLGGSSGVISRLRDMGYEVDQIH